MLTPRGLLLLHRLTPARSSYGHLHALHPGLPSEPVSKDLAVAEALGWELLDVETLAQDYARTVREWISRLRHACEHEAVPSFTRSYRAWLLYLVEIAASLDAQELQVHRILLRRSPARRIA